MLWRAVAVLSISAASAGAQSTPPIRSLVEELRIDGRIHEWTAVDEVRVGPGGHILVAERRDTTVRVFSPAGQLVRSIGRRGQGPGEFERIGGIGSIGDTIWAGDPTLRRLTYFDLAGNVLGTTRVDSAPVIMPGVATQSRFVWSPPRLLYPDGRALISPLTTTGPADTLGNVNLNPIWRTTRSGRVLDTVAILRRENAAIGMRSTDGARTTVLLNPFPQRHQFGVSPDGRRFALASASYDGRDAWTYEVRLLGEERQTIYTRRFPFARVPVPARVVDSIVAAFAARLPAYQGFREALPVPPSYSPVTRLMVATDGAVWIRGRDEPAGALWTILDPRGEPVASVREPAGTRFIDLDRGLWAIERDADDVESIVRYRVANR